MNLLVLDDNKLEFTGDCNLYAGWHVTQTVGRDLFFEELYLRSWDEVWVDHDLGVMPYNGKDITKQVQDHWAENSVPDVKLWVIITNNYTRQAAMVSDLRACGYKTNFVPQTRLVHLGIVRGEVIPYDERDSTVIRFKVGS